MPEDSDNPPPGLVATVQRILGRAVAVIHNRVEILLVELQEERMRMVCLFLLAGGVIGLGLMTMVMLTLAIMYAAGEEHRLAAAIALGGVYLAGALVVAWRLSVQLMNWPPFPASRNELRKDREWLQGRNPEA